MGATILLVEDGPEHAVMIREALSSENYSLEHVTTVRSGWKALESVKPDLVILDIGLPDGSGIDLCRRIRSHATLGSTPVILLTGKGGLEDKASGFDAGADHYLVKPLQINELRLWVGALLRRIQFVDEEGGILRAGDCVIDPKAHAVTMNDAVIKNLTRKEFDLLYELMRRKPRVLSKDYIMKSLWNTVLRDNTIEVHVRNLRAKLGPAAGRIVTVPGAGYRFE